MQLALLPTIPKKREEPEKNSKNLLHQNTVIVILVTGHPCELVLIVSFPLNHAPAQSLPFAVWDAPALKELNLAFNLLTELPVGVEELPLPTPPPGMATSEVHVMLDLLDKFMY